MGRTKKLTDPSSTPRSSGWEREQSIRSYLHAATRTHSPQREAETASQEIDSFPSTLARLSPAPSVMSETQLPQESEWRAILPNLLTKADLEALSDRLGRVVREEVAQLRADLANVEACMSVAESETRALRTDLEHTNSTVTNQEADIASLTMWVDDLDNRGRRMILRVRGLREGDPAEHIPDILKRLFTQAGIPYRWGYPFSLSAKHGPDQHGPDQVTSQVSSEPWAYHRSKYQTGWRDRFSNHRLGRK
ncbi:Hypothetical predicted protein [Pelobates cultripes]|uniref:Uncharacterized protein n=1 Tax=Pelobates cultripes TaxID=61616 RepID=A0AAD1VQ88_PELCU|nr:Hypothetical predicted protein [Pelobates cultripes]